MLSTCGRAAPDQVVFQTALVEERVLVSADTDFGALLVPERHTRPSLILFRHGSPTFREDLTRGAIVVFRRNKFRIRKLFEQG
jgi:predicted nuclease of predicted toxin-antitoxin system